MTTAVIMSRTQKRKRSSDKPEAEIVFDSEDEDDLLLPINEVDGEDTSDEELDFQFSDYDDDINEIDDFGNLNLSDSDDSEASEEWEDIESEKEVDKDNKNCEESDDSDYVGSCHELQENHSALEENKKSTSLEGKIKESGEDKKNFNNPSVLKKSTTVTRDKSKSVSKLKKKNSLQAKSKKPTLVVGKKSKNYVKNKLEKTTITTDQTKNKTEFDEYATSDEEDLRNTVGNVPLNWYDEYDHVGYGLDGLPINKPKKGDALDKFLEKLENADYGRTVYDKQTDQNVKLSDDDLRLVQQLMGHCIPDAKYEMYAPFQDLYSHEVMEMPLSGTQLSKKSFIPSKHERLKVTRLAYLIRRGLYRHHLTRKKKMMFYNLWKPTRKRRPYVMKIVNPIPPPPMRLPGHSDSYNPPPEYLMQAKDESILQGREAEKKRSMLFNKFWRKFKSVREIPSYRKTMKERVDRLTDLYMAPRKFYKRIVAKSKDFLPEVPNKKDLRPYPTLEELVFKGHRSIIRTISIHPGGKYLASGSDDHTVRVWEVGTGRCLRTFEVEEVVKKVSWNPNPKLFLLGIAMGNLVVFLNPETYLTDKIVVQKTNAIFKEEIDQGTYEAPTRVEDAVKWRKPTEFEWAKGFRVVLEHFKEVKEIVWHRQGDYFVSVIPDGQRRSVIMHQLSRWRSQLPFQSTKGRVQTAAFHPKLPHMFIATQSHIRVYDLKRQRLIRKIQANSRWVSCIAVHPGGENFIIGGYDRRVNWFEVECTKRPHLMRYHGNAVRSIKFHRKYPLFASCSDDTKLFVAHGTVYDDFVKDPLIVLLKQLKGHSRFDDYYVLDLEWHPYEPYLFTAGADATIRLWH